jgi:hypothetical protein
LKKENQRALLILDGHSTRNQFEIWRQLQQKNIDVLILPSHSSNFTQPLDVCVNAGFKQQLSKLENYPGKNKTKENINLFMRQVRDCIHLALNLESIKTFFIRALILDKQNNLQTLENQIQSLLQTFPVVCPIHLTVYFIF